jgi:hypothetical protein
MKSKRTQTSTNEYILQLHDGTNKELLTQLKTLGTVAAIPAHPELLHLRLSSDERTTPKKRWATLKKALGASASVFPVFLDDKQMPRLPVGTIVIRFKETPTDADVDHLAEKHQLVVQKRNQYAPQQIAFTAPDDAYLPEILGSIEEEANLEAVWPETLSQYSR